MSNSISTVLVRNLSGVFGGNDPSSPRDGRIAAIYLFFDKLA